MLTPIGSKSLAKPIYDKESVLYQPESSSKGNHNVEIRPVARIIIADLAIVKAGSNAGCNKCQATAMLPGYKNKKLIWFFNAELTG
jgi:hypothetical protein